MTDGKKRHSVEPKIRGLRSWVVGHSRQLWDGASALIGEDAKVALIGREQCVKVSADHRTMLRSAHMHGTGRGQGEQNMQGTDVMMKGRGFIS